MKTAISIPDALFQQADQLAADLGISRSELYSRAVRQLVDSRRDSLVTRKLNEIYGFGKESNELDPLIKRLQFKSIPNDEEW